LENRFAGLKEVLAENKDAWGLLLPVKQLLAALFGDTLFGLPVADLGVPVSLVIFILLAVLATVLLHFSVYGRYFYAIGSNERAARYSGIATDRYKILAYVWCSLLAAFFAILFLMEENSVQPSDTGSFFELYAIAGAVLGGCSLRGCEGNVLGIFIGTAILWILPNFTNMWGVPQSLKFTVIGGALLLGAMLDELLRARGTAK
jgi:ribose transport system permease protein